MFNENHIELNVVTDLYDEDEKGIPILIKRDIKYKTILNIDDILNVSQVFNNKGRIYKTKCKIQVREIGNLIVNEKYETIRNLKTRVEVKGFRNE